MSTRASLVPIPGAAADRECAGHACFSGFSFGFRNFMSLELLWTRGLPLLHEERRELGHTFKNTHRDPRRSIVHGEENKHVLWTRRVLPEHWLGNAPSAGHATEH